MNSDMRTRNKKKNLNTQIPEAKRQREKHKDSYLGAKSQKTGQLSKAKRQIGKTSKECLTEMAKKQRERTMMDSYLRPRDKVKKPRWTHTWGQE